MVDVVILVVGDLAQLAPQLALAIETNKLPTCAFLFLPTDPIAIPANIFFFERVSTYCITEFCKPVRLA